MTRDFRSRHSSWLRRRRSWRMSMRRGATSLTMFTPLLGGWKRLKTGGAGRLEEIEDRLAELDRLKRKYGQTLQDVIAFGAEAARQLAEVENRDALLVELKAKEEQDAAAYRVVAAKLTASRVDAAKRLEK